MIVLDIYLDESLRKKGHLASQMASGFGEKSSPHAMLSGSRVSAASLYGRKLVLNDICYIDAILEVFFNAFL